MIVVYKVDGFSVTLIATSLSSTNIAGEVVQHGRNPSVTSLLNKTFSRDKKVSRN